MKAFVIGAGGFIGGYWVKHLLEKNYSVIALDIKPLNEWYQILDCKNIHSTSGSNLNIVSHHMKNVDEVYNFACNMGGIGFCENNHLMTGLSVDVNTNIIKAALDHKPKKIFYSSSACVYNELKQTKVDSPSLKESDAWPAQPDLLYGLEKLFSEELYKYLYKEFGVDCYIARFHNVYGPLGTWDGGREKAPAAAIRKIIQAKKDDRMKINMWGDGKQTRSFMYIDDCIEGIEKIINEPKLIATPINLGSDELVTIKHLHDMAADLADINVEYVYDLDAAQGVKGRNSDNNFIESVLSWKPNTTLSEGMKKTFDWILSDFDNENSPFKINHKIRW